MIHLQNVSKLYKTADSEFQAVSPLSLTVNEGEIYGIIGFSGAGKSTLLRVINLLEAPTTGQVFVNEEELTSLNRKDLRAVRKQIGMIFQHFHLLHNKTVFENVALALELAGQNRDYIRERVLECLDIVELTDKADQYPSQLSGGQKQRVAIARALANKPKVLLCDEPTSALDPQTTKNVLDYLSHIHKKLNLTIVIVTHEMEVARTLCSRVAIMEKGKIVEELNMSEKKPPATTIGKILLGYEEMRSVHYV